MVPSLKKALKRIEEYKKENPSYAELLDVFSEILILREEYSKELKTNIFQVDAVLVGSKLAGGLPLVDLSSDKNDLSKPKEYFAALLGIAEKIHAEETRDIRRKLADGELNYDELVRKSVLNDSGRDTDDAEEDSFDLVGFFLEESLRPALEQVAGAYREKIRSSGWTQGYCPVCGQEPKIGEIRDEEGRRFLFCNQCGTEWYFRRIKCPFCGNEEQKTLSYFSVEDDERYRVDVCDVCKRYVKIVDARNSKGETNMDVEDIATLHLDMLANDEGYH